VRAEPIINIKNLDVTYFLGRKQEVRALENIALTIYPGEFIIFFGPSGCGKSTLLYSISGLESHARGEILVGGKNVATMNAHEAGQFRQKKIGMIFQAFYLISTLSVQTNVELPQIAVGTAPDARAKRAKELLEHFGVASQANKRPTDLSGGQQQRVAICRALMNDPDILLADEPVGNLDSKSSNDVINLIRELNQKQKKTVILVTHDPSHLHLAHRVFYMRDGHIVDIKVNQAINEHVIDETAAQKPPISKELELLIRSFSSLAPNQLGTLLIPYKAKEIVSEVLTGRSIEEVAKIEHEIQHLIIDQKTSPDELKKFLDRSEALGGMGFDHRTAVKLAEKIQAVLREIRELQAVPDAPTAIPEEVRDLRFDLIETCKLHFDDGRSLRAFDTAIHQRVLNTIDARQFVTAVGKARRQGGPGLRRSVAVTVSRRLELLLLGKFTG
jgi:putative ABC transport system ATP-binding protein